jgi:tRNA(Ile2) C34 agmatinyltransferase TiaS
MKEAAAVGETLPATCPHCKKEFEGELISDDAGRYRGFKCPHCRLFVPEERADEAAAS